MTHSLWIASPLGWWRLDSTETHLLALDWLEETFNLPAGSEANRQTPESKLEQRLVCMLSRYFKGEPVDFATVPVQWNGTGFQNKVLEALREVPYGETRSYQWLAINSGNPNAVRAVGGALSRNPLPVIVPCHRIITSDGALGGFMSGRATGALRLKTDLLALEGISLTTGKRSGALSKGCP